MNTDMQRNTKAINKAVPQHFQCGKQTTAIYIAVSTIIRKKSCH